MQTLIADADFVRWVRRSLEREENVLARSNQGTLLKFSGEGKELLVKCPMGEGMVLRARRRTLFREHQAYQRLEGLAGVPQCYGLVGGEYLAIEYIRGVPYREAQFRDRDRWFSELLEVIRGFHDRGVNHGDLKSKSNILVTEDERPCVIDFGTAFVRKPGLHPFNNWMFNFGIRLDLNAWVKHKYHGRYEDAKGKDREILRYTWLERLVRRARGGGNISYD
jgi:predicted Ser/Thr protein kinase